MTIDNYAPCPCGSGKKMKYCKCVDQPQEYEKIVRFLEGGQELAALDRVNQLLAKSPNAAWLLAIKGELALSLGEDATFRDTAQRFLKLKPNNPLALVMRSLVAVLDEESSESAARLLLEGLAESREALPRLAVTTIQMLVTQLHHGPKANLRFYWLRLLRELLSSEQQKPVDLDLPTDNLLMMSMVHTPPTPPGAAWTERANEVAALISAFRYAQAETKLRSILRDYPDQPGPLAQLLQVQLVLLDQDGATSTARKLSSLRELPEAERDYFSALVLELENGQPGISWPSRTRYCEIASEEEARNALSQLADARVLPDDVSQAIRESLAFTVNDEVAAKTMCQISLLRTLPSGVAYRVGVGSAVLFGRQTDKPARALIVFNNGPETEQLFEKVVAAVGPQADLEDPSTPRMEVYSEILYRVRLRPLEADDFAPLDIELQSEAIAEEFLNMPLPALNGMTLLQAAEQEPMRGIVRAVLNHFEGLHHIVLSPGTMERIYERLQMTRPVETLGDTEEPKWPKTLLGFTRLNVAELKDSVLTTVFAMAHNLPIMNLSYIVSLEVLKRPRSPQLEGARAGALNFVSQFTANLDDALPLLEQLEEALMALNQPVGNVVMRRFGLLSNMGREAEARDCLRNAFMKYPNDPQLLSVLQYINQQSQRDMGDSAVNDGTLLSRMARRTEAESDSGLVLPGQEPAGAAGKSRLWLPGT